MHGKIGSTESAQNKWTVKSVMTYMLENIAVEVQSSDIVDSLQK